MVKATQQQDLSILTASKKGLVHLTSNDWTLIVDKAIRRQFKAGELLVQLGRRTHGLFVIVKGNATVQIPGQSRGTELGPGQVCGEISFIDELPATADVVAVGDTDAYYLDRPTLQSLFELFPHLGSRFYRSLATILSGRLRDVIAHQAGETQSAPKESAGPKKSLVK